MFSAEVQAAAQDHARDEFPKESVGAVVHGAYIALQNTSEEPTVSFKVEFSPDMEALIHSHTQEDSVAPSEADMIGQQSHSKPWGILSCHKGRPGKINWFGDCCPIAPYVGREFLSGVRDCWCLARDIFRKEFDIDGMPNPPRDEDWYKGKEPRDLFLLDMIKDSGFSKVDVQDIQPWDLALGSIHSRVINHCGIYIGNDLLLHHTEHMLSCRVPITPWLPRISYFLRHEKLKDAEFPTFAEVTAR